MPGSRRDFTDDEFVEAVEEHGPGSTVEIAEAVGCTRSNARIRLLDLHERGEIEMKEVRGAYMWLEG